LATNAFFKKSTSWEKYCARTAPRSMQIYRAVENISKGQVVENGITYNEVCALMLVSWAGSYLGCDKDKLLERIS